MRMETRRLDLEDGGDDDADTLLVCSRMSLIMWPVVTGCTLIIVCTSAELCSAYPVAGAMATWTWIMARRGLGGERFWGWLMGGMVAGYHIGSVSGVVVESG